MVFLCCAAGAHVNTYDLGSDGIQLCQSMSSLNAEVTCARYNHNGKIIASCSVDGGIALDVAANGELLSRFFYPAKTLTDRRVNSVHFSSGSRFLASGGNDGCVRVWDLKTQEVTQTYNISASAVTSVTFSGYKDDFIAAGSESGAISLCDVQSTESVGFLSVDAKFGVAPVTSLLASPHPYARQILGSTYGDGSVRVWDLHTGQLTAEFANQHDDAATCLAISPVSKVLLASGGHDRRVLFFDTQQRRELRSMDFEHAISALALCADGKTLAVGTTHGDIQIFDLRGAITPLYSAQATEAKLNGAGNGSGGVHSLHFASPNTDAASTIVSPRGQPILATERLSTGRLSPTKPALSSKDNQQVDTGESYIRQPETPLLFSPPSQSSRPHGFTIANNHSSSRPATPQPQPVSTDNVSEMELLQAQQTRPPSPGRVSPNRLGEAGTMYAEPSLLSLLAEAPPPHTTTPEVLPLTSPTSYAPKLSSHELDRRQLRQEAHDLEQKLSQYQTDQQKLMALVKTLLQNYDAVVEENANLRREIEVLQSRT